MSAIMSGYEDLGLPKKNVSGMMFNEFGRVSEAIVNALMATSKRDSICYYAETLDLPGYWGYDGPDHYLCFHPKDARIDTVARRILQAELELPMKTVEILIQSRVPLDDTLRVAVERTTVKTIEDAAIQRKKAIDILLGLVPITAERVSNIIDMTKIPSPLKFDDWERICIRADNPTGAAAALLATQTVANDIPARLKALEEHVENLSGAAEIDKEGEISADN